MPSSNPRDQGCRVVGRCRGGQMSDMSFIWHNRLPRAVAVPPSRCPAVRINERAFVSESFPKIISYLPSQFFRQLHNVCTAQARYCVILAHTSDRYTGIRYATIIRLSIWLQRAWRQSNIHNFIYVLWRCGLYADDVVDVDVATADEL